MNKYYYISYAYKYLSLGNIQWSFKGIVSNTFPLEWIYERNDLNYTLLSWQEITEEEYNKYKTLI